MLGWGGRAILRGKMSVKWIDQEIEILKKMNAANRTPEDVALVLKSRTPEGIRCKSERMGLKWVMEPEIDIEAFKKMMGK
jgi:hypothetical protein